MEVLAWILLIAGVIVGGSIIFALGSLAIFLFVMSSDSPYAGKSREIWVMRVFILGGWMTGFFLIFYWIYYAYLALQANNPHKTILLISIGFLVGIGAYIAFKATQKVRNIFSKKKINKSIH